MAFAPISLLVRDHREGREETPFRERGIVTTGKTVGKPFLGKRCFPTPFPKNSVVLERGTLRLPSNCFFLVQNSSPVNRNVPLSKRIYKVELSELPDCSMNPSANRVTNPLSPNASPLGEVACEARRRGFPFTSRREGGGARDQNKRSTHQRNNRVTKGARGWQPI